MEHRVQWHLIVLKNSASATKNSTSELPKHYTNIMHNRIHYEPKKKRFSSHLLQNSTDSDKIWCTVVSVNLPKFWTQHCNMARSIIGLFLPPDNTIVLVIPELTIQRDYEIK